VIIRSADFLSADAERLLATVAVVVLLALTCLIVAATCDD
jgi:hypothetical protein